MSNGINIGKLSEDEFKSKDRDERDWIIYRAIECTQYDLQQMKAHCSARLTSCQAEQKKDRFKNTAIQFSGGVVGGASAVGVFFWTYIRPIIDRIKS